MNSPHLVLFLSLCMTSPAGRLLGQVVAAGATGRGDGLKLSASTVDVFPLSAGYHFTYQYVHRDEFSDIGYHDLHFDSGTVSYRVIDSSRIDDTTIGWHVSEVRGLFHIRQLSWFGWGGGSFIDSSWYSVDSSTVELREFLTGAHELRCSAIVWNFPIQPPFYGSVPAYRYADTSEQLLTWVCGAALFSTSAGLESLNMQLCGVKWVDGTGTDATFAALLSDPVTGVSPAPEGPSVFTLSQNYPNPFNPTTTIRFTLSTPGIVTLKVYDMLGTEVHMLVSAFLQAGEHSVRWDARNLASGVYFCRLTAGTSTQSRKLLLQR
jgi:hypothetical protein